MKQSTCVLSMLSAWFMAVIYYFIEMKTGVEPTLLLVSAIATMVVGLYLSCRESKETKKEEI